MVRHLLYFTQPIVIRKLFRFKRSGEVRKIFESYWKSGKFSKGLLKGLKGF